MWVPPTFCKYCQNPGTELTDSLQGPPMSCSLINSHEPCSVVRLFAEYSVAEGLVLFKDCMILRLL